MFLITLVTDISILKNSIAVINFKIVIVLIALSLTSCFTKLESNTKIRVDMSAAHDSGIFKPENGDKISIAGSFNDWEPDISKLTDEDGDWVFETSLSKNDFSETAEFKFVIVSDNQVNLPNSGWETIPNRQVSLKNLTEERPTFQYNKPWSPLITQEVSFRVNMSNQQVLGFFDPKKGDKIVVSGTFNEWDREGIELDRIDTSFMYEISFPVQKRKYEPLLYKFRIESNSENILNNGWELKNERIYSTSTDLEYFNDQKRVLNLTFSEEWIREQTRLNKDDVFYAKLEWNSEGRNYLLKKNRTSNTYEVAIQIPEVITDVDVVIVKNLEDEILIKKGIIISLNGKEVKF